MTADREEAEPRTCEKHGYAWRGEGLHGMGCPRCEPVYIEVLAPEET